MITVWTVAIILIVAISNNLCMLIHFCNHVLRHRFTFTHKIIPRRPDSNILISISHQISTICLETHHRQMLLPSISFNSIASSNTSKFNSNSTFSINSALLRSSTTTTVPLRPPRNHRQDHHQPVSNGALILVGRTIQTWPSDFAILCCTLNPPSTLLTLWLF